MINNIHLPSLNACLNACSATFLLAGFIAIKRKRIELHKICMSLALVCSLLFLGFYLYYHFHFGSTKFEQTGWIRSFYFFILISHTILATVISPFVIAVVYRAWSAQFDKHAKLARWIWPLWMYVSITGVMVYWMLYQM